MLLAYPEKKEEVGIKEYFVILNQCYQVGVFMSRSSLQYVKIHRIWILSVIQGFNFAFMFINTRYMLVDNLYFMCPFFIWIGLMGGGSYVNVMHNLLELPSLKQTEKEGAVVLSLMFNDVGILTASIFT